MGQYLKLPKGASPAPGRFLKWVPLAPRINWKKTIYEKKGSAQNPAFCAGLIVNNGHVPAFELLELPLLQTQLSGQYVNNLHDCLFL